MHITRHHPGQRYSEAVVANGFIFTTQVPRNTQANAYEQTLDVLEQIDSVLNTLASDKSKIIEATVFLADMKDYEAFNCAWDEWVAPAHAPSRTTVAAGLANPEMKVEIKIIAV